MRVILFRAAIVALIFIGTLVSFVLVREQIESRKTVATVENIGKWEAEGFPEVVATDISGREFKLSSLKGKVVIINFWASWCEPCLEEFPSLLKLLEAKPDVHLVAVSADHTLDDLNVFLRSFKGLEGNDRVHVIWDSDKAIMKQFSVDRLPESYVGNRDLKLVKKIVGSIDWFSEDAKSYFDNLLK